MTDMVNKTNRWKTAFKVIEDIMQFFFGMVLTMIRLGLYFCVMLTIETIITAFVADFSNVYGEEWFIHVAYLVGLYVAAAALIRAAGFKTLDEQLTQLFKKDKEQPESSE